MTKPPTQAQIDATWQALLCEGLAAEILRLIGLEYPHWLRRLV